MEGNPDKCSETIQPLKVIFTEGKNDVAFFGYLIRKKMNFDKDRIYTIFEKKEKTGYYIGSLIRKINGNPPFFANKLIIFGDSGLTVLIRKILPHFVKDIILKKWSDIRIILIIDRDYRTEKANKELIEKIPDNLIKIIEKTFGCKCQIENTETFDIINAYIISIYVRNNIVCRLHISIYSIREELEEQVEHAIKEKERELKSEDIEIKTFFKRMLSALEDHIISEEEAIDSIFNTVYENCDLDRLVGLIQQHLEKIN